MAVLTAEQLAKIRRGVAQQFATQNWDKPQINAALQAIEDWFELNKASGVTAVNTATAPFVFTGPQKKELFAYWLLHKFGEESL